VRSVIVVRTIINGFSFEGAIKDPIHKAARGLPIAFADVPGAES